MPSETCETLDEAGASEGRARAAGDETAAFEIRAIRVETRPSRVLSGTVALMVDMITLLLRSFVS